MKYRLTIFPEGATQDVPSGTLLSDALDQAGYPLRLNCAGRGICGTCAVEIVRGPRLRMDGDERVLLARRKLLRRFRLACRYQVAADVSVRIPPASRPAMMPVLTTGIERTVTLNTRVRKFSLSVPKPDLDRPDSLWDVVRRKLSIPSSFRISPEALTELGERMASPGSVGELTAVLYDDDEALGFENGDTTARNFGLAIDLGTTTLVVELVDLNSGRRVGTAAGLNPQTAFGADVVSRISTAFSDPSQAGALRSAVVGGLNDMIAGLLEKHHVAREHVYETVLAGNTAMNHMFLGVPVATLAVAPFAALFSVLPPVPAAAIGLAIHPRGKVILAPNIKSFVGGDIAAGLVATGLDGARGRHLFIDLGTNGEIVLKMGTRFVATSTAAGPAFEGMTISCGMLAEPGAVCGVEETRRGGFKIRTIGGIEPRGLCGTGLIDVLAVALKRGLITPQGRILKGSKSIPFAPGLALDQQDVREFQLAAAAVKSGIRLLLGEFGMTVADLDGMIVAGAFGNSLNVGHAVDLGLLPRLDRRKIVFVGNAALSGARVLLLSKTERRRCERFVGRIRHLNLASGDSFQTTFVEALAFGPWT